MLKNITEELIIISNHILILILINQIVLVSNYSDLIKTVSQKFRFKPTNIRLFVAKKLNGIAIGTELLNQSDFEKIAVDGVMLAVSNKTDFRGTLGIKQTINNDSNLL